LKAEELWSIEVSEQLEWEKFYKSGKLESELYYKMGVLNKEVYYDENGKVLNTD
jgi:antitoxin component YwqK of YwqJK toxin-antitoxin module